MADKITYYKAVIFLHGNRSDMSRVKKNIDSQTLIIGCDGGTQYAFSLGLMPHIIVGDMDSLTRDIKNKLKNHPIEYIKYPIKKDNTDAELALLYAIKRGCKEIIITGILGTRIDHMLATIHMLANPKFSKLKLRIIEGDQNMHIVWDNIKLRGKKGDIVSLIPLNAHIRGVTTQNLAYSLQGKILRGYETLGISNVFTKNKVEISLKKGTLLVVHQHQ